MRTSRFLTTLTTILLVLRQAPAAEVKLGSHTFTLPDGLEIELAAGPPLVDRPIVCDFDELGRLYVADSAGSNDKVEVQLEKRPHRIVRLEDTDSDGRFDRSTVFADKMMFPEGVLWHDGAVYCGAPPSIWKLEDTDGDGVADRRSEWHQGKTLTGCANDLHGPYLGLDGWIYWAKGAFAKQEIPRHKKPPASDSAAHLFRARPDGSGRESFMAGGMDNPVEVVFTPEGELIFTTTFFVHPEAGRRDALVHAVYGGVYPKPHGVLDGIPRTGDLLPCIAHLGPAVPSGLCLLESDGLGDGLRGSLVSTQFNYHKVQRHRLEPAGATFATRDEDLIASEDHDFHPTDAIEDADGSLLVLDTGGWYKLCCPSSQMAKPEVLGAVYRIRRKGTPRAADARGLELDWAGAGPAELAQLVRRLDDPRPAVRKRALAELARRGEAAVAALAEAVRSSPSSDRRRNAAWALSRIGSPAALAAARAALSDADGGVRTAAAQVAGLHRDPEALPQLLEALRAGPPHLRRAAAQALGRLGDSRAVRPILEAASEPCDRMLEHSLIYALIEIGDRDATRAGLAGASAHARRAALIALDQTESGGLAASDVAPLLASSEPVLRDAAAWVAGHHPEWGKDLAGYFRERIHAFRERIHEPEAPATERARLVEQLAAFARGAEVQELLAAALHEPAAPAARRVLVLEALARAGLKEAPPSWSSEVARCLGDGDEGVVRAAVGVLRAVPAAKAHGPEITEALLRVAGDLRRPADLRLEALRALPAGLTRVEPALFAFLRECLDPDRAPLERAAAASVLARAALDDEQLLGLAEVLREAGPIEFPQLLEAFKRSSSEAVGLRLVESLKESRGLASLRPDSLKQQVEKFPEPVARAAEALAPLLNADLAAQRAKLEELASRVAEGDPARGRAVFNGPKAACNTCHTIGYLGGRSGPDMTRIGSTRSERDLLESILYPSSSFVRSYEPVEVVTRDGRVLAGVLKQESAVAVRVVVNATEEVRVELGDVLEMRPGSVSIMPEGLDAQLTAEELLDVVAFLRSMK
ncbi:MAG: HEAT repeat domain-containing protein [Planctomycetes bacterium]|nr:HEAT repeat domain-containing protein [Planctomycetota bacterium]